MKSSSSCLSVLLANGALLLSQIPACLGATGYPSSLTIRAARVNRPGDSFGGFQRDLLDRLVLFAREDNVTLQFQTSQVQQLYNENLQLISSECQPGESISINSEVNSCGDYDMLLGDFWTSPSRYESVDFTPPWLQTSIAALRVAPIDNSTNLDVTTLAEASETGTPVCIDLRRNQDTFYIPRVVSNLFPNLTVFPCHGASDDDDVADSYDSEDTTSTTTSCVDMLKAEFCALWVSDEMVVRKHQLDDPLVEMSPERLQRQLLAWPVRKSLDTTVSFLLNKWMYAAISNQTVQELYTKHFEEKRCPLGFAGQECGRPCNPDYGRSNTVGRCVCDSIRWAGPDCNRYRPEELNMIAPAVKVFSYFLLGINLTAILVCAIWLYLHRNTPQVKVSQPMFLVLVLLGCFISSSTILFMAQEDEGDGPVHACAVIPWMYSIGFSITFGSLFAKIYKVYRLFTQQTYLKRATGKSPSGSVKVDKQETLQYIGAVLVADVIILTAWTLIDPLEWQRYRIRGDKYMATLESEGYCNSNSWMIFGGLIGLLHFGLLLVAAFFCYRARNIPSKYSEHRSVSVALLSTLQMFIIGIPILIIASGDPEMMLLVRSLVIWMNDFVVLALVFGNLMYNVQVAFSGSRASTSSTSDKVGEQGVLKQAVLKYRLDSCSSQKTPVTGHPEPTDLFAVTKSILRRSAVERAPPHSTTRRPLISALSMGSTREREDRRTVSFAENITMSQFVIHEESSNCSERDGSGRFDAGDNIQGAPLKPRRHFVESDSDSAGSSSGSSGALDSSNSSSETRLGRRHTMDSSQASPRIPTRQASEWEGPDSDSTKWYTKWYTSSPSEHENGSKESELSSNKIEMQPQEKIESQGEAMKRPSNDSLQRFNTSGSKDSAEMAPSLPLRADSDSGHGMSILSLDYEISVGSSGSGAHQPQASDHSMEHGVRSQERFKDDASCCTRASRLTVSSWAQLDPLRSEIVVNHRERRVSAPARVGGGGDGVATQSKQSCHGASSCESSCVSVSASSWARLEPLRNEVLANRSPRRGSSPARIMAGGGGAQCKVQDMPLEFV